MESFLLNSRVEETEEVPNVSWKNVQYPPGSIGHRIPKVLIDEKKQIEYVKKILGSKVYDVAIETPLQRAPILSEEMGSNLWLKREDTQKIFSFKIRGAYNMISQLPQEKLEKGVVCASAGNHAQGVALAAKKLKIKDCKVVMPETAPKIKIDAVERLGGEVVLYGDTLAHAKEKALEIEKEKGLTFIPPDHEDVIAGQGTVGMEIARQMKGKLHAIFVPIGSGSQACGIANFYKLVHPKVKIFGVQLNSQNAMAQALKLGYRVNVIDIGHFADGIGVQQVSKEAFRICKEMLDDVVLVDKFATSWAIKDMFNNERSILEPSGALSIAAAKAYCKYNNITGVNIVAITSGANMNFDQLCEISDLAHTLDQTIIATVLPDQKPTTLQKLADVTTELKINITEIRYRFREDIEDVVVVYRVEAVGSKLKILVDKLESCGIGFKTTPVKPNNHVVRDHLRYMMGGRSRFRDETLFCFTFPERSGALKKFLQGFKPDWNISLFHHRQQGIISSDVLVGVRMKESEKDSFLEYATKLGYKYNEITDELAQSLITKL